jgi:hypothetical protein
MLKLAPAKGELSCAVVSPIPPAPCLHCVLRRIPEIKSVLEGGTLALLLRSLLRDTANCPMQKNEKQFTKRDKSIRHCQTKISARRAGPRFFSTYRATAYG